MCRITSVHSSALVATALFLLSSCGQSKQSADKKDAAAMPQPDAASFQSALITGDLDKVKWILDQSPMLIYHKFEDGASPLHVAVSHRHAELTRHLIPKVMSLDLKDAKDRTPLHMVAMNGDSEIIQILLHRGARPTVRDHNGATPLKIATAFGHKKAAELIENAGGEF